MGTMIPRTKKMDKIQLNLNAHEERLHPIWKKTPKPDKSAQQQGGTTKPSLKNLQELIFSLLKAQN